MRVLIVEDNPIDAEVILERLRDTGSPAGDVEHLQSIAEIDARALRDPDVVLLDLSLPDARGLETVRRAQSTLGDVAIVVLTSDDDPSLSLQALREGAEDYLVKGSFSSDTLFRALRYARERFELRRRLAHSDRLATVGRLAAGVAHEIANPAMMALASLERLDKKLRTTPGSDAESQRLLKHGRSALERIRDVVRDLQGYARIDRGRPGPICLNDRVANVISLLSSSLRHTLQLEQRLGEVAAVDADPGHVEQVLTNLIMNAAHAIEAAGRQDGRVIVSTEQREQRVLLVVEDNGTGMSDEVRTRMFEPFFTTRAAVGGTGLGLPLVAEMVRQSHGELRCHSELGRGTRFEIEWPASEGQAAIALPAQSAAPPAAAGPRTRVLFVDDEPAITEVYSALLSDSFDVTVAIGGRAAIELLRGGQRFDVVVCDLMMPQVDGPTVYDAVVQDHPELARRFLMCSGGLVNDRAQGFAARGVAPLLYKPVPTQELKAAIERLASAE